MQAAATLLGTGFVAYCLGEAEAVWALWAILFAPVAVLLLVLALRRGGARLATAVRIVLFLSLSIVVLLKTAARTEPWAVPAGAVPGALLVGGLVLLSRRVGAATARKAVMAVALAFGGVFLVGLTASRERAESEVLREKMLERLREPMRLEAEAYARELFRIRTLGVKDDATREHVGSSTSCGCATSA